MPTEKVSCYNDKNQRLAALLELPEEGEPQAYGIFAHCFTCNKNYKGIRNISRTLAEHGIAMLALDFAGLGESEGEFSETNLSTNVDDLLAAARFLEEEYQAPKLLVGHSMGGAAVLQAAARIKSTRAVVTVGAPSDTEHLRTHFPRKFEKIESEGEAEVSIGGVSFRLKKQFVDDLKRQSMEEAIKSLKHPLMVVHSIADATVDIEHGENIYLLAGYPKAIISLDNADHLLSSSRDSEFVGTMIASWADRYLHRSA